MYTWSTLSNSCSPYISPTCPWDLSQCTSAWAVVVIIILMYETSNQGLFLTMGEAKDVHLLPLHCASTFESSSVQDIFEDHNVMLHRNLSCQDNCLLISQSSIIHLMTPIFLITSHQITSSHHITLSHISRSNTNSSTPPPTQRIPTLRHTPLWSPQSILCKSPSQRLLGTNLLTPDETVNRDCNSAVDIYR